MPSLENWGGRLKSLLWAQLSLHTVYLVFHSTVHHPKGRGGWNHSRESHKDNYWVKECGPRTAWVPSFIHLKPYTVLERLEKKYCMLGSVVATYHITSETSSSFPRCSERTSIIRARKW